MVPNRRPIVSDGQFQKEVLPNQQHMCNVQWMAGHSGTVHVNPAGAFCLNGGLSKEAFETKVKI